MDIKSFTLKIKERLENIYGELTINNNAVDNFIKQASKVKSLASPSAEKWSHDDVILITYGDSIKGEGEKPLDSLNKFLLKYLGKAISHVHILPFFPYSSDDGFSVIDYKQVNPELGTWTEVAQIDTNYKLMFDLVINHISQHSTWFQNYLSNQEPGKGYFIEVDPETDLSAVVRPRSLPLLSEYETSRGKKHVWTTFSADQIDLNFGNPEVLLAMMNVFLCYLEKGARIIRLDAIAFLWKEIGSSCLHLKQTHEVVKLMRDIADFIDPSIIILTETNVPHKENLSYFGNADEASMVYQFSLPPLLLHALYNANTTYLNEWAKTVSEVPEGCTFFNFTASHDGIGVRPLEGLLPSEEIFQLAEAMKESGGHVSTKRNSDGSDSPYELNITYFDALTKTKLGADNLQQQRFLCSQTLMMSFKGVPAFYIHSLLATRNYHEGVKETGAPRSINRRKWSSSELYPLLEGNSTHSKVLKELIRRISIRKTKVAFHPDAQQEIIPLGKELFCMKRGSDLGILILANLSTNDTKIPQELNEVMRNYKSDLITGNSIDQNHILAPYQVCWYQ